MAKKKKITFYICTFTISTPDIENCEENHPEINHRRGENISSFKIKTEVLLRASDMFFISTKLPFSIAKQLQTRK